MCFWLFELEILRNIVMDLQGSIQSDGILIILCMLMTIFRNDLQKKPACHEHQSQISLLTRIYAALT